MDDTSFDFRRPSDNLVSQSKPLAVAHSPDSALSITLHPLVVINISDHFTRASAQMARAKDGSPPRVFGILLGEQTGRRAEVINSFEIKVTAYESGALQAEFGYVQQRLEQYKKTFPNCDMLGWYSTATRLHPGDLDFHKQLMELNESLLYLMLDPIQAMAAGNRELPIALFESEIHMVLEQPTLRFAQVQYKIDSIESERIAVDHVAHILPSGDSHSGSVLAQHMGTQYTAMSMLLERVEMLHRYLCAVQAGNMQRDQRTLRQIKSLCNRLPALDSARFQKDFLCDFNNALLVALMGCITESTGTISDTIDKYNTAYDKHSRRRGIL